MNIIHLETTALRNSVVVRPSGQLGTCGFYPCAWQAISVTRRQAGDHSLIRRKWREANPNSVAASIDAPAVVGVQSTHTVGVL